MQALRRTVALRRLAAPGAGAAPRRHRFSPGSSRYINPLRNGVAARGPPSPPVLDHISMQHGLLAAEMELERHANAVAGMRAAGMARAPPLSPRDVDPPPDHPAHQLPRAMSSVSAPRMRRRRRMCGGPRPDDTQVSPRPCAAQAWFPGAYFLVERAMEDKEPIRTYFHGAAVRNGLRRRQWGSAFPWPDPDLLRCPTRRSSAWTSKRRQHCAQAARRCPLRCSPSRWTSARCCTPSRASAAHRSAPPACWPTRARSKWCGTRSGCCHACVSARNRTPAPPPHRLLPRWAAHGRAWAGAPVSGRPQGCRGPCRAATRGHAGAVCRPPRPPRSPPAQVSSVGGMASDRDASCGRGAQRVAASRGPRTAAVVVAPPRACPPSRDITPSCAPHPPAPALPPRRARPPHGPQRGGGARG